MNSNVLVGFLLLALLPLVLNEAGELAPWLAIRLVQWSARRLGSAEATERYSEEWAANLEHVPGRLTKLTWACGLLLWSVPALRWRAYRRTRLKSSSNEVPTMLDRGLVSPDRPNPLGLAWRSRPNPLGLAWRWRYEAALLVALPLAIAALIAAVGNLSAALLIIAVITTGLAAWPAARRRIIARGWCIVVQHRIRAGCAQAWIHNRRGRLPAVLWCGPKSYGEQMLLWCPAGVTAEHVVEARDVLASACYASDIEVVAHPKYPHLVYIGVIRS